MVKLTSKISFKETKALISRWPISRKVRLVQDLSEETRKYQWDQLLRRIRSRARKYKITQKDIDKAVEEVRQELYDSGRR